MGAEGNEVQGPLAIISCGGTLPFAVADAVVARGRNVALFAVEGVADASRVLNYTHDWVKLGEAGRLFALMRGRGCREVVFIGSLTRPPISKIRLDLTTLFMLPSIVSGYRGGDDHLLRSIGSLIERNGFRLVGAHEVAPSIAVPKGVLTRPAPADADTSDIEYGLALLSAIGPFDVGQGVAVVNRHVVAVEGIEGTDDLLARITDLRQRGRLNTPARQGVLIKAPKPGQDRRFDLPAIGPKTVQGVAAAGLAGIAVRAGEAIMAEPEATIAAADRAEIFIVGVEALPQ